MNRIVGLETEYGCLTNTPAGSFIAVERVRDWIFGREEYGLIDVHHRDWDEPPGNGGFLFNGGRVYIDMGHLEYCTPECVSLLDILRYDRAGDALAMHEMCIRDRKTSMDLADRFRHAGAPVFLVNVAWSPDFKDALRQRCV